MKIYLRDTQIDAKNKPAGGTSPLFQTKAQRRRRCCDGNHTAAKAAMGINTYILV
jgi:hypothetical protein